MLRFLQVILLVPYRLISCFFCKKSICLKALIPPCGVLVFQAVLVFGTAGSSSSATYFVSSSFGEDNNDGLTEGKSLKTIDKVNHLNILAGDKILFKCGDIWRGEMLIIAKSGAMNNPVTFGFFPEGCANKPVLSGSRPIDGWVLYSGNIYVADLSAGTNAGKFPLGMNQVFRNGTRLPIGRWPNPEADDLGGQYHNGYSVIDGQTASNKITDNQLPAVDWTGEPPT